MPHLYEIDVPIPMRDGVVLAANVWRPVEGTAPTLLMRLPYSKDADYTLGDYLPVLPTLLEAGYSVVMQDCRGTFRSEGEFVPHAADRPDGEDTIAWIAEQPWSDGTVGMYGPSYMGMVQWEPAVTKPPSLKAIAPCFTSLDKYGAPWYSAGGALSLSLVTWWCAMMYASDAQRSLAQGVGTVDRLLELGQAALYSGALNEVLPTAEVPVLAGHDKWWSDWLAHPAHDEYWDAFDLTPDLAKVDVPALHIGGWYDLYIGQTVRDFAVGLRLFVSTSAVDTDFTAKLVDVFPDGRAINLCDGILRARYRNGLDREDLMEPGTVYEVTVDMTATSNVFLPGHRIRLDISSSNFPRYDRNTNTGGVIAQETEDQMIPAINRIHHGPEYPSRLVLPIIDRKENR